MDFYSGKSRELSRFIYRNAADALAQHATQRPAALQGILNFINALQPSGDWQKMKWCMPEGLRARLMPDEAARMEEALASKRRKRNDRLIEVYPHCADEFSTRTEFLDAAFGSERFGLINKETKIFTIGSCFARNIANYLHTKGYRVSPFVQAEDLNSPFSNAKMLAVCAAEPAQRRAYIEHWVNVLYPPDSNRQAVVEEEVKKLEDLTTALKSSEFLVVTCGNVLDYFLEGAQAAFEVGPNVAPKFLSISQNEDIAVRMQLTAKFKETGAKFRMGDYREVEEALEALYTALRSINPGATLLFTLSPVPIDSAIHLHQARKQGAIEIDCISKSLLRSALSEFMNSKAEDKKLFYFPSFEIVRWVGACIDGAIFGKQDAASRHISQDILSGVYAYFVHKFGDGQAGVSEKQQETEAAV